MTVLYSDGTKIVSAPYKDPDSIIDYGFNWAAWLATGETIASSVWVITSGVTADSDDNDTTTTSVTLSGGTVGTTYTLTNRITTSAGRTEDRSMFVYCVEK